MVNYSDLNDAEIAQKVFFWVNSELCQKGGLAHFFNGEFFYSPAGEAAKKFDPCNNHADAWPIIAESKITMLACDDLWIACPSGSVIDGDTSESQSLMYVNSWSKCPCMSDVNPLRAAMVVFLMMQEAKNG